MKVNFIGGKGCALRASRQICKHACVQDSCLGQLWLEAHKQHLAHRTPSCTSRMVRFTPFSISCPVVVILALRPWMSRITSPCGAAARTSTEP